MQDSFSFEQVYQDHVDMVYNLCLNYLHQQEDAEEVTQDVFLKVHEKISSFEARSSLKTWIYRMAINRCLDHLKAKKRQKRFGFLIPIREGWSSKTGEENGTTSVELFHFDHPGVLLEDKEDLADLFRKIDSLPAKQKTALILKTMDGLSVKEIADVMELSAKAIESLLSRAKANLKKIMDDAKD